MRIIYQLIVVAFLASCSNDDYIIQNPQPGDIYVFEENSLYFPIMVDSVTVNQVYAVNSKFKFADAIPQKKDLPKADFDFSWFLIYEKKELERLYKEGNIVCVYR